jgi:hypothetical protein
LEDEGFAEDVILLEVETDAEVVEKLTQLEHFVFVVDVAEAADVLVFSVGDLCMIAVVSFIFKTVADFEPGVGEGKVIVVDDAFEVVFDLLAEIGESSVVGEVDGVWGVEFVEFATEFAEVEVTGAPVSFVADEENGAVVAEKADVVKPEIVVGVFSAFVGDEEVEGASGEEEQMGLMVDGLSAEVPDVDAILFAVFGETPFEDVDTFGAHIFCGGDELVVGVYELFGEASFT